nr:hypothetical protein [Tanacetum cinerariifolium]
MFRDQGQPSLSECQSLHVSRPSRLCAQAQSGDDMPFRKRACKEYTRWKYVPQLLMMVRGVPNLAKRDFRNLQTTLASLVRSAFASTHFDKYLTTTNSGPIESRVRHLLGSVIWAMMSPSGSTVASIENVNGFLAVYTPSDDLIRTDFEKKGVVPEVMLHIREEFVFLLGRNSLDKKNPRMVVCKVGNPWGT